MQKDILCLRERHLLERFAAEISNRLSQGESREQAFLTVIIACLMNKNLTEEFVSLSLIQFYFLSLFFKNLI